MRNLTLTFLYMEREHVGKDVTCVPHYLGKALGCEVEIVSLTSATNRDFPTELDGIRYRFLFRSGDRRNGYYKLAFFWWWLIRHARKVDVLMRFHYSVPTMIEAILYKMLNPRGKVYVKCDTDHHLVDRFSPPLYWVQYLKLMLYRRAIRCLDVVSVETSEAYRLVRASESPFLALGERLVFVPNGFDERMLERLAMRPRPFAEKERLVVTVGRIGTEQKNTEMLLEALARIDWTQAEEWRVALIGTVEPGFVEYVERFYEAHPGLRGRVLFTGPIYDKRTLWTWYDRARVFVLTSRWESYGLVLNEARRFGNYILTTDVGAARDLVRDERYGSFIPQEDAGALAECLQRIMEGTQPLGTCEVADDATSLSWETVLRPVVKKLS